MSRLLAIRELAKQSPNDPFVHYGLAMELKNSGQRLEATEVFADLRRRFPGYLAQYLMHGNLLVELEQPAEARAIFEEGVRVAREQRNQHTLSELEQALAAL